MVKDIVPDLLKDITETFDSSFRESETIIDVIKKITDKKATYSDAHDFAVETGNLLSESYRNHLNSEVLPDGKMYYNIADRIVSPTLENNYQLVSDINEKIQEVLNEQANLHIQAQRPELNQDRIKGIVNRLSNEDDFDLVKWLLDDPIVNFTQSIVDDSIKINAEFHYQSGLAPKIIRGVNPGACQWCKNLAGTYDYKSEPQDVYRRHENCRCKTDFYPRDGRGRQNVWNKKWNEKDRQQRIDFSKGITPATPNNVVKKALETGQVKDELNVDKQARHLEKTSDNRSYLYGNFEEATRLYNELKTTGTPIMSSRGWTKKERVIAKKSAGIYIDPETKKRTETDKLMIIYSKKGGHIYPRKDKGNNHGTH